MVRRDKSYKKVEIITLIYFSISVITVCITRFIPFIFLTLLTFPISFKLLKASATYAEISGKRDTAEKDLYQANKDIMRVTQQINACLDENKEDEAMQYAMKKSTLENKINVLKDTIEEMKEAQAHQKDIRDQAAEELQKLKEERLYIQCY